MNKEKVVVAIVMGSDSDWPTMKHAATILDDFGINYKAEVVSAHRTPDLMYSFASDAESNGFKVIIAGAGGAAHLPGMIASKTNLPVLGVPIKTTYLEGKDSLLSIVQMPKGIPVATFAIGEAGAYNAALFVVRLLSEQNKDLKDRLEEFSKNQEQKVLNMKLES
ncbi:MAG: 5-(carboxyamino)imidazole ribonucleotide mutase [Nitrosomonadales bacterium]|jgi:5-(carboxyamino)imidazole ribonucleotide mutase|nr:5-(carboxyamino)imidazole ribonucleotide mutase [Nitrosomonadales bacterium]MBT6232787.1 5-(carboxyamino)imidazole ribonucleotide mutase [Nitrosomonadales bacterium]MBT6355683.1 5-(carboxyamino)imidazole ribonucleotide mutase [Nitrosomonadales bacterium]MCH9771418.1 5-(carboxyamino)imidazole ribonucleotide mutase [Betaproteobacteria bacterium]MDC1109446.1 5-(carboxyamino)imidazole ribonucleotide mutase [Methylophilaceae bacterium]